MTAGALKAADIGISIASAKSVMAAEPEEGKDVPEDDPENAKISTEISTSEAAVIAAPSIAAPFATGLHHIGAVQIVVTEGRGTLATSFTMFKYMFLYGIVQFVGVLILYYNLLELASMQYLYADLFVVLPFVTFMPSLEALPSLKRGKPECNLVSFPTMRSIFGHTILIVAFQILQQWILVREEWYHPPDRDAPGFDRHVSTSASSKFLFSNFMYIFLALALCQTYGLFRVPIYKNIILTALVVVEVAASTVLVLFNWELFDRFFQVTGDDLPLSYRRKILVLGFISGFTFLAYERFCVPHKSLDEDPVPPSTALTRVVVKGPSRVYHLQGDEVVADGEDGDMDEVDEEEPQCCLSAVCDRQPTLLPKIWHHEPLYWRGMQVAKLAT
jgi:magnesium-transporting ATPase (P-type)